jgi:hypothetical protein
MKHQESINPSDLQRDAAKLMEVASSAAAEADRNLDASAQIIVADADVSHLDKQTILNRVGQNLDKLLPTDKKKRLAIALLALANVSGEVSPVEHSTQNPVQPSAPGKPVLVMRNTTERPEAVEAGTVKLVGVHLETIVNETQLLLNDNNEYEKMAHSHNPYGDGNASKRIIEVLRNNLYGK